MSIKNSDGATPFDRLRAHYEASGEACPACGHVDGTGEWRVTVGGRRVEYRHRCPSCDAVQTRELRL
jgi:hypothetical protein